VLVAVAATPTRDQLVLQGRDIQFGRLAEQRADVLERDRGGVRRDDGAQTLQRRRPGTVRADPIQIGTELE